jgi:3-hydroxyisobutyryl-CoA hydrolase
MSATVRCLSKSKDPTSLSDKIPSDTKHASVTRKLRKHTDLTFVEQGPEHITTTDEVYDVGHGQLRVLMLNRPKQLNSLNLNMIRRLTHHLLAYERNPEMSWTILRSKASPKAFCAGGDVKALWEIGQRKKLGTFPLNDSKAERAKYIANNMITEDTIDLTNHFFREEYQLNWLLSQLAKPVLPIVDGIMMGGGVGISVHSNYTIATENTIFAMPETAIGFFPDVGGSFFLSRLAGSLGMYLGLTGHRLKGADVLHAGIASHYIKSHAILALQDKLTVALPAPRMMEDGLDMISVEPNDLGEKFTLEPHLETIAHCFSEPSVEKIIESLKKVNSPFAQETLAVLAKLSPTSLKVTHRQITEGTFKSLDDCLKMEFRMTQRFMTGNDFFAGVDAALVSKTQKPVWSPASLKGVTDADVQKYFDPLSDKSQELVLAPIDRTSTGDVYGYGSGRY